MFDGSDANWNNLYYTGLLRNPRYQQFYVDNPITSSARQAKRGQGAGVTYYDDTAVITFDEFTKYSGDVFSVDLYSYDYEDSDPNTPDLQKMGSELLFLRAFEEIEDHGGIHIVVIDLALNGGGRNDVVPWLQAFMTDDPVHTSKFRISGQTFDIHYDFDLNQDGYFGQSDDTYQGQYDFYILTSRNSFSCGNYLPTTAYANGYATLIGERSGGGTCCVGNMTTAYGTLLRSSSNHFLGYWDEVGGEFHNNESGIPVQYSLAPEDIFDNQKIDELIASIH